MLLFTNIFLHVVCLDVRVADQLLLFIVVILLKYDAIIRPLLFQDVMVELYKRNVWKDAKTVNVITTALFSKVTKVSVEFCCCIDDLQQKCTSMPTIYEVIKFSRQNFPCRCRSLLRL